MEFPLCVRFSIRTEDAPVLIAQTGERPHDHLSSNSSPVTGLGVFTMKGEQEQMVFVYHSLADQIRLVDIIRYGRRVKRHGHLDDQRDLGHWPQPEFRLAHVRCVDACQIGRPPALSTARSFSPLRHFLFPSSVP